MPKVELYNDHFQNFKRYNIPKAQLVIADIPYNLANNAYASNPQWYVEVLSPAEGAVTNDKMWSDYMRRAIKMLCDCDFNVRLPGWCDSAGARLETQIADALGIINIDLEEMLESLQPDEMEASK